MGQAYFNATYEGITFLQVYFIMQCDLPRPGEHIHMVAQ
ncbi:hypothetical protein ANO14919_073880 [Xylariales sp. No.14919]|nr:hypothetical protein ANO14919_073880 [Xylariales sp. No.14919]